MPFETKDVFTIGLSSLAILTSLATSLRQYKWNERKEIEQRTPWFIIESFTEIEKTPGLYLLACDIINQNYRPAFLQSISVIEPGSGCICEAELEQIGALDRYVPQSVFSRKLEFSFFKLREAETRKLRLMMKADASLDKQSLLARLRVEFMLQDNANTKVSLDRTVSLIEPKTTLSRREWLSSIDMAGNANNAQVRAGLCQRYFILQLGGC